MIAEEDRIIYSTERDLTLAMEEEIQHKTLKSSYPSRISLRTGDSGFPFKLVLRGKELIEAKDLLDGVNPLIARGIKFLVARPAYYES